MDVNSVRFPGIGLEFEIRRYAFEVFGIQIYWYGIIIAFAFLLAVLLAVKSSKKHELVPDNILDLVLFAAPVAVIFARLFYVIFSWDQYRDNLIDVFKIRDGGLAIYGGVIGALLVAWLYTKRKKISFLHLVDFGIPYLVLGQGIGRWGNFVNQEAFGTMTSLPWRMNGDVADRYLRSVTAGVDLTQFGVHPTFLYESLWDIAVFLFLIYYRKKKKLNGEVLFLYLILYGTGRAIIEGLRTDSLYVGTFRVSQLLSIVLVAAGLLLFIYRRLKKRTKGDEEPVELGQSRYGTLLMKMKEEESQEAEKKEAEQKNGELKEDGKKEAKQKGQEQNSDTGTVNNIEDKDQDEDGKSTGTEYSEEDTAASTGADIDEDKTP